MNAEAVLSHRFTDISQRWQPRDAIIYALGVGLGNDPVDELDLPYLDEKRLSVLPTFAVTLSSPGMWLRGASFGVNFSRLVHLAQDAHFYAPLPSAGEVVGTTRVASLTDRGADRGAELVVERSIGDAADGRPYCTLRQTLLLRGDGGFGGPPAPRSDRTIPDRRPDFCVDFQTSPRAALIYRLSGDWNPLHIDPGAARAAGFERPILQGLGVYGAVAVMACRAIGRSPSGLRRLSCRFAGIVIPGDRLELELWRTEIGFAFVASVGSRRVIDAGVLETE